jgi:hypothetical protein
MKNVYILIRDHYGAPTPVCAYLTLKEANEEAERLNQSPHTRDMYFVDRVKVKEAR